MKNIKIQILITLMLLLSLFSGISINGNWGTISQYEFKDFLELPHISVSQYIFWGLIILSHTGIVGLLFLTENVHFKKLLFYFPFAYLIGYLALLPEMIFLLIPFTIAWIYTMRTARKHSEIAVADNRESL